MSWDCPNCGHTGNQKNFCGKCGCPRPKEVIIETPSGNVADISERVQEDITEVPERHEMPYVVPEVPEAVQEISDIQKEAVQDFDAGDMASGNMEGDAGNGAVNVLGDSLQQPAVEQPQQTRKSNLSSLAGVVVLLLCLGAGIFYFVSGGGYEDKCNELASISHEVEKSIENIKNLSGDASKEDRTAAIDGLKKNIEKLDGLAKDLREMKPSDDQKEKINGLLSIVEYDKNYLQSVSDIINYDKHDLGDMGNYVPTEFTSLKNKYLSLYQDYRGLPNIGAKIKNEKSAEGDGMTAVKELVLCDKVDDALSAYLNRKSDNDRQYLAKLKKEATDRINAENESLKKKEEVVFLVSNIYKGSGNRILIDGLFYNCTKDNVAGVKEHLVDVSLYAFDDEVFSLNDQKITVGSSVMMAPGGYSQPMTISIDGQGREIPYFTTAEVSVHKIRWVVRRMVKR